MRDEVVLRALTKGPGGGGGETHPSRGDSWLSFLLAAQDHNGPSQRYVGSLRTGLAAFQWNKPPTPPHRAAQCGYYNALALRRAWEQLGVAYN